jgi:ABC-type transport system involved in cytochrome bd biosynthesis fused ATPase/permease subunit
MKGLFVKDIELMKQQKQFFILVVVMGVILNLAGSGSVSFATGYFTIVTAIFAITLYKRAINDFFIDAGAVFIFSTRVLAFCFKACTCGLSLSFSAFSF